MSQTSPSGVDVAALRRVLDGRWAEVRDGTRARLEEAKFEPVYAVSDEEYRQRIHEQMQVLADTNYPRVGFPEEYGGLGDVGGSVTAFETLAFSDLSLLVKAGVQWGLFGGAILHLGTERHHEAYLERVISYELPGCFAMTETGHGSDVQSLGTTATFDPATDEFVIHTPSREAYKDYIGNAAVHGRMAAVFAQLRTRDQGHGVHCFLVPIRDDDGAPLPGVTLEDCGHKLGLNGVDNGRIAFDEVRVPRDNLLDRYGRVDADGRYSSPIEDETKRFFTMLGTLVQGRISISGAAISAAKTAMTIAVRYGLRRRQFGPPGGDEVRLLDYRVHQRRLLPRLATTYAMHFTQSVLVERLHDVFTGESEDRERRQLETMAAGIKALTTWHSTDTIQECREACGGAGYMAENRLGQLKSDTDVFATFEGDNTVLLQLVAKSLMTDYREAFGSLDTFGTVRFVAEQVVDWVVERSAGRQLVQRLVDAVPGREEDTDLRDRGWHLDLLEYRESHVIDGVAQRLRRLLAADDVTPFEAFNRCQDHLVLAARAYVDRLVLENFVAAIDAVEEPGVRDLLQRVCDLHVLSLVERERGWFLEHGRISASRSKAVIAEVNELCAELRHHVEDLVEAFGIPEASIAAPIATAD